MSRKLDGADWLIVPVFLTVFSATIVGFLEPTVAGIPFEEMEPTHRGYITIPDSVPFSMRSPPSSLAFEERRKAFLADLPLMPELS